MSYFILLARRCWLWTMKAQTKNVACTKSCKNYLLYVFEVLLKEKERLPTCIKSCYLTVLQYNLIPLMNELRNHLSNMLHVHYNSIITHAL